MTPCSVSESDVDASYYDGFQTSPEVSARSKETGQPVAVVNLIFRAINTMLGQEAKARSNWKLSSDQDEYGDVAEALQTKMVEAQQVLEIREDTLCLGLYEDSKQAWCTSAEGNVLVEFATLVVATGAYDKLPTVLGNDLPGVIGLRGFEALAAAGSISTKLRVGAYGTDVELWRALSSALAAKIDLAFLAGPDRTPACKFPSHAGVHLKSINGSGRGVASVDVSDGQRLPCDLLVICESQPTYELQAQNGSQIGLRGQRRTLYAVGPGRAPMIVVGEAAGWFDPRETVERTRREVIRWLLCGEQPTAAPWTGIESQGRPGHLHDDAFLCFCEDVRVRDVRRAIADGYSDVELVKRHTGAGTGPCQGKLCHGALLACVAEAGLPIRIPTPRPLIRPVELRQLVGGANSICTSQVNLKEH